MATLSVIYCAFLGAAVGSFAGCAAYRLPRKESLMGRSHCPACGEQIPLYWNIPVISWLLLHGRTRCCHTRLSPSYLFYELTCAMIGGLGGLLLGLPLTAALLLSIILIIVAASSIRRRAKP